MKELMVYILKSALYLTIFSGAYRFLLKRTTSYTFNRVFLLAGLLVSFILPMITFTYDALASNTFDMQNTIQNLNTHTIGTLAPVQGGSISSGKPDVWTIIGIIYFIGAGIALLFIILNIRYLISLKRSTQIIHKNNSYKIVSGNTIASPFSILRTIFMNDLSFSNTEKELIIKHESAHIKQYHWIDILGIQCAQVLLWFYPLVRIYAHYIKENHEYMADRAVLLQGVKPAIYKALLVNQTFRKEVIPFSNSFNYSQFNRLKMMETNKKSTFRKVALILTIPVFGLVFRIFAEPVNSNYSTVKEGCEVIFVDKIQFSKISATITIPGDGLIDAIDSLATSTRKGASTIGKDYIPIYKLDLPVLMVGTEKELNTGKMKLISDDEITKCVSETMNPTFDINSQNSADETQKMIYHLMQHVKIDKSSLASWFTAGRFYSTNSLAIICKKGVFVVVLKEK
jgi:beta-lactamase regulating signal transducer with metallopeptidase domain